MTAQVPPRSPSATSPAPTPRRRRGRRAGRVLKLNVRLTESGPVAQLGARLNGIQEVTGSIPVRSTNLPSLRSVDAGPDRAQAGRLRPSGSPYRHDPGQVHRTSLADARWSPFGSCSRTPCCTGSVKSSRAGQVGAEHSRLMISAAGRPYVKASRRVPSFRRAPARAARCNRRTVTSTTARLLRSRWWVAQRLDDPHLARDSTSRMRAVEREMRCSEQETTGPAVGLIEADGPQSRGLSSQRYLHGDARAEGGSMTVPQLLQSGERRGYSMPGSRGRHRKRADRIASAAVCSAPTDGVGVDRRVLSSRHSAAEAARQDVLVAASELVARRAVDGGSARTSSVSSQADHRRGRFNPRSGSELAATKPQAAENGSSDRCPPRAGPDLASHGEGRLTAKGRSRARGRPRPTEKRSSARCVSRRLALDVDSCCAR